VNTEIAKDDTGKVCRLKPERPENDDEVSRIRSDAMLCHVVYDLQHLLRRAEQPRGTEGRIVDAAVQSPAVFRRYKYKYSGRHCHCSRYKYRNR
jgi:hypothetical protein